MNLDGIISCPQTLNGPQKPIYDENEKQSKDFHEIFENIHCCEVESD